MKTTSYKYLLSIFILFTACKQNNFYAINNRHKPLSNVQYIYDGAKDLGLINSGILVMRDTNKLIHSLPSVVAFNKDGKIIPSTSCYAGIAGYITFLDTIKAKPPLTDTSLNLKVYSGQEDLEFLDGKKFTEKDLPPADYYVFIEWLTTVNNFIGKDAFNQINKEIAKKKNSNNVIIIYIHAFDLKKAAKTKNKATAQK